MIAASDLAEAVPVVVTGLGTVHPAGCGRAVMTSSLASDAGPWQEVDRSAGYHRSGGARLAGLCGGLDLSPWLPARIARRMSLPSRLARVAAQLAFEDAGLTTTTDDEDAERTAIVVSNAYGPLAFTEAILRQHGSEGPMAVSPMLFTESVANAPAAQVAIWCGARGKNLTVTQREAGPLIALMEGAREISRGRADRVVVVAVDEVTPLQHAIFDRFRALARTDEHGTETARPFDRHRNGFIAAEGATAVVLEPLDKARQRFGSGPGKTWIRVAGGSSAFDPTAPAHGWGTDAAGLAASLQDFLGRIGLASEDFDAIVSSASGSIVGDRLEARVLKTAWGTAPLPPILVPKAATGELGGGLLAGLLLAAEGTQFATTPGFIEIDPELDLVPYDGRPMAPPRRVLAIGLAVGGAAAYAVLERGSAQ